MASAGLGCVDRVDVDASGTGDSIGDLDADGDVDEIDVAALLRAWGPCPDCSKPVACLPDLDGDCQVTTTDLLILLGNWG